MTSSALPPDTSSDISDSTEDNNDATLVAELGELAEHIRLVKMEGRVFVRFSGVVKAGHLVVPYALVPAQGVLARPAKWRKMDREAKLALVRDPFACKPAIVAETDDYVAIASEFRSLAHLPDVKHAQLFEPKPEHIYSWSI